MKKVILVIALLLLCGCGNKKVTCTNNLKSDAYNRTTKLEIVFEKDKVISFTSDIKEDYVDEIDANDAYIKYQTEYDNYNENAVISSYKKDNLTITATYQIDSEDIKNKKVVFEYNLSNNKDKLLNELKGLGFKCN